MIRLLSLLVVVLVLNGCTPFRDYVPPSFAKSIFGIDLSKHETDTATFSKGAPALQWWREFDDPMLADLVETALDHNLDLRIALANLNEARAIARQSQFDYFPTVTANGSYARTRTSGESASSAAAGSQRFNDYQAGFDARWELDLFGRVSEAVAANRALSDAAKADLDDMRITIAAEIARSYMELRGAQYRLDIAERNASNQRKTFRLAKDLERAGQSTALDTARAKTQLRLTESNIPSRRAEVASTIRRISVLSGQTPDALTLKLTEFKPMPSLPARIHVGDGVSLLKRRPDVTAAERRLAAETARYNVATTEYFPVVNIVGALGFSATNLSNFGSSAIASTVGPAISWRAFDLGRAQAEIDQSDARAQAALAGFEKTVLEALEETQNALSDYAFELQRRESLQQAAKASQRAARLANQRYREGVDDFLDALDTERTQLEAEDALAQSEIAASVNLVQIYKALAGGWGSSEYADEQSLDVKKSVVWHEKNDPIPLLKSK